MPHFDLSIVPAVPRNSGAFDSMPKLVGVISNLPAGFWQGFDHKNLSQCWHITGLCKQKSQYPHYSHGPTTGSFINLLNVLQRLLLEKS